MKATWSDMLMYLFYNFESQKQLVKFLREKLDLVRGEIRK